jgi:hypothetical protein
MIFELLNGLLVKWNLTDVENYYYRISDRALTVKLLDLLEMNTSYMTIETIWFSIRISDILESAVFDEAVF